MAVLHLSLGIFAYTLRHRHWEDLSQVGEGNSGFFQGRQQW